MPHSLRFALRSLRRTPAFSLTAILILTLGIGATVAMFTVTRTVLLKPLAYRDPGQLVTVLFRVPQFLKEVPSVPVNAQHYQLWRDHARSLSAIAMLGPDSLILSGRGQAVQLAGVRVTPNFFQLLGVYPALGRSFDPGENQAGRSHVAIVSDRFWREKLGGRRDALGQTIRLDGQPFQVIGVMPAAMPFPRGGQLSDLERLPEHTDYWVPLVFSKDDLESPLANMEYIPIARLRPGVTVPQALAELTALEKVIAKTFPQPVEIDPVVRPLQDMMAREVRLPLLVLMGAVAAVLLIVCLNLMNLMLVRAAAQQRAWAIRLAVGAGMGDVLRGVFVESLLLSLAGGAFGLLLASWLLALIRLAAPLDLPRVEELHIDPAAAIFALALAIGSAVLFGFLPAWRAARTDPQEALQSAGRGTSESRSARRAGKFLVAAEVALSTVLLLAAVLLLRSFAATLAVNPGVDVEHVLTMTINLPPEKYGRGAETAALYQRLEERANVLSGVRAAGLISDLPLAGQNNENPVSAGDRAAPPLAQWLLANFRAATNGYFRAAGIPFLRGATFTGGSAHNSDVILTENLAARLWPGQNAIGRPLRIYGDQVFKVTGVVGATHAAALTDAPTMMVYFPEARRQNLNMSLVLRSARDPSSLAASARRAIAQLEPEAAIPKVSTMRQVVANSVAPQRFEMLLLASFAAAALVLALLGIYGVLAFLTARRTAEIGIRMALGARPAQMLRSILQSGMTPVFAGLVAGLLASAAFARILQRLLFQVHALDPAVYSGVAALLLLAGVLACLVPARRAAQLDPASALRHE